ncbi:GNAT family N-acetyltransferase [Spiroplasma sp. DGKH1]|uniref:GNAT family N-acetyltransferase n=1 Tax=Spiroplasma sp. DGKH1 TaxID=3050074 RepID=UPI0034C60D29
MLKFNDPKYDELVENFIAYTTDPDHNGGQQKVKIDLTNKFHYVSSINAPSNLNIVMSGEITTPDQKKAAQEIVKPYLEQDLAFTWCTISKNNSAEEKQFMTAIGLHYHETDLGMIINLDEYHERTYDSHPDLVFTKVTTPAAVADFRKVIENAFELSLIDLTKYPTLLKLNQQDNISHLVILYQNGLPAATGHLYFQNNLAIIDDIATHADFQRQGLATKMLNYLLTLAKKHGYHNAGLIATTDGYPVYKKIGFEPIEIFFNVYITKENYAPENS